MNGKGRFQPLIAKRRANKKAPGAKPNSQRLRVLAARKRTTDGYNHDRLEALKASFSHEAWTKAAAESKNV